MHVSGDLQQMKMAGKHQDFADVQNCHHGDFEERVIPYRVRGVSAAIPVVKPDNQLAVLTGRETRSIYLYFIAMMQKSKRFRV